MRYTARSLNLPSMGSWKPGAPPEISFVEVLEPPFLFYARSIFAVRFRMSVWRVQL